MTKEILQEKLMQLSEKLINIVNAGLDQAPQLVHEILNYNAVIAIIGISVGLILVISCIGWYKLLKNLINTDSEGYIPIPIFFGLSSLIGGITLFFSYLVNLLQIKYAPTLFLIKEIQNLFR